VKRTLPLLLKYFAVVGIACFLAYFISHTIASAAVPGVVSAVANANANEPASYALPPIARAKNWGK